MMLKRSWKEKCRLIEKEKLIIRGEEWQVLLLWSRVEGVREEVQLLWQRFSCKNVTERECLLVIVTSMEKRDDQVWVQSEKRFDLFPSSKKMIIISWHHISWHHIILSLFSHHSLVSSLTKSSFPSFLSCIFLWFISLWLSRDIMRFVFTNLWLMLISWSIPVALLFFLPSFFVLFSSLVWGSLFPRFVLQILLLLHSSCLRCSLSGQTWKQPESWQEDGKKQRKKTNHS